MSTLLNAARHRKIQQGHRGLMRKAPVIADPRAIAARYRAILRAYVRDIRREAEQTLIASLPVLVNERDAERLDAWDDRIAELVEALRVYGRRRSQRAINELSDIANGTAEFNRARFNRAVRAVIGVDIFASSDGRALRIMLRSWVRENTDLIQDISQKVAKDIGGLAQRAMREGAGHRGIARDIRRQFGMADSRARLIARDQVAKLNGQITQHRNELLGIERYVWSTSEDERVRESHRVMNNKLCRWDNPAVYSDDGGRTWKQRSSIGGYIGHPGSDFQCRCVSSPDLSGVLEELAA